MFFKETLSKRGRQNGFSLPELAIVLLIVAIITVLVLPQLITSRRLFHFSGVQRQIVSALREARQEALSQRTPITFRFNNTNKIISLCGGNFGNIGDTRNRVFELAGNDIALDDINYGRPAEVSVTALGDGTNLTTPTNNFVDITFQSNGMVIDKSGNPQNKALFFYNSQVPLETAFAVSVLGAGGRVKIWRYNQGANLYVE